MQLVAGRNVQVVDSFAEFLINETYAKDLGFQRPADAVNQQLLFNGKSLPIVGVLKDFHAQSTHSPIGPVVFAGGLGDEFHIRLRPKEVSGISWQTAIAKIQRLFLQQYPDGEFSYSFVDDKVAALYETEKNTSRLLVWATGLMIFISCLGLLGLVIYTTNRRRKEIGVRKVLGASVSNIVTILSGEFIKLVFIAFLVSVPVAWWAVNKWLDSFVYRTAISWWIFALTAIIIILFSIITLSIQTIRSAVANPVDSLRNE
jgi:ABC-type antimicrobial peptide transport system permease subunit